MNSVKRQLKVNMYSEYQVLVPGTINGTSKKSFDLLLGQTFNTGQIKSKEFSEALLLSLVKYKQNTFITMSNELSGSNHNNNKRKVRDNEAVRLLCEECYTYKPRLCLINQLIKEIQHKKGNIN
jgi:hypothetical protein